MPTSLRFPAFLAVAALLLGACGGGDAGTAVTSPAYLSFRDQPTACGAERPETAVEMVFDEPDDMGLTGVIEVILDTSCGDITLALDTDIAPITVNSFVFLAEQGYYDGIALHRVVPGFMAQIGDPTATGGGSPGYLIPDELPPGGFLYQRGVVAMANRGPDTGGSQFFLMIEDALVRVAAVPMGPNPGDANPSRPLETIYINHVEVVGR